MARTPVFRVAQAEAGPIICRGADPNEAKRAVMAEYLSHRSPSEKGGGACATGGFIIVRHRRTWPMEGTMSRFAKTASRSLLAGIISAALLWPAIAAESTAIPNFAPDGRVGWVAGVPDGENPVGQDLLQPPSGPGPVHIAKAPALLPRAPPS